MVEESWNWVRKKKKKKKKKETGRLLFEVRCIKCTKDDSLVVIMVRLSFIQHFFFSVFCIIYKQYVIKMRIDKKEAELG